MNGEQIGRQLRYVSNNVVIFIVVWTAVVCASLFFSIQNHRQAFRAEVYTQARAIHAMDLEYRTWAINHGGVYVPVSEDTPPSKYLAHVPERDITTPSGRKLTLLNSSYITRQVQEMMRRHGAAVRSHISSLKPINPVNKADDWEAEALSKFEQGVKEVSGIEERSGKNFFRYMKPMITEKSCLKCHAQQGYKVGDVRGGISVSIPIDKSLAALQGEEWALASGHGAVWLLGMLGLYFFGRQQRQALRAAHHANVRYDDMARRIPVGLYIYHFQTDGSGAFDYVSPRFCEILGINAADALRDPKVPFAPAHPDDLQSLQEAHMQAFSSQEKFRWEGRFIVRGEERWVKIESDPTLLPDGESLWNGVVSDITEHKLAEIRLRKSEQELAEAQRVAQVGNWELDLVTGQLKWSDEIFEIFEIDKAKFGASYEAFLAGIHPDDRDMVNDAYNASVQDHSEYEIEHRLLMPDGRIKHVQERGKSFYDEDGKALRSIGTVQDISRLHEVEEQLRQAQKMEAVGTLVGGIAHDFNNKLAAITGNLYLAQRTIDENSEAGERLKAVEKLSFEAASMVQQLLTFARKGKVEQAPLTLVTFIKEAAKLNRVAIPENIEFSVDYGDNALPVKGDVTQLQQVFLNLLTNARDALDGVENPRIDVKLSDYVPDSTFRSDHPESEGVEAYACIQVSDNGHGIDAEHMAHIFDPFFTTKDVGKGTGLGLAMVYGVTQAHRGVVEVESSPGEGTCFSIYLPLNRDAAAATTEQQKNVVEGQGETILIADDDANVLETFSEVLSSINYRILKAHNGREVVEIFRQHADEIDLVILDIVMPGLKGPEAAARIREIRPDVNILYATGYDSQRDNKEQVRDAGVLDKPYALEQVSRTIRQLLDRKTS